MRKEKLTDLKIKNLKAGDTIQRITDRDKMSVEVRPTGRKVFIFRYQWNKTPQTITLGRYPALSLGEARQIASSYCALLDKGMDPRATLKPNKVECTTLKFVAEAWFEKNKPCWRKATLTLHTRSLYRDILPLIGDKPIDEITKADLLYVIHPHEELGHTEIVHRLHARLKAIFDYGLAAGLTENYPFSGLKKALSPKPKIKNHVSINPNQAHQMLAAIKHSKANIVIKLYIELLAHLLVRPNELRLAEYSEFNLQQAEWSVPTERMKMDAPHWVPLTPQAIKIIKELKLINGFTPYLFSSPQRKIPQPISETCARNLLHKLGYKNLHCLHGFRSLASTVLHSETHFRSDAIEAQQARKVQGVRGIYMRADFKKERRELMEWYSQWLTKSNMQQFNIQQTEQ